MPNAHGDWIWYELMTPDAAASADFYGPLLNWTIGNQPDYREIQAGDGDHVGGILQLTPEMTAGGARPVWAGYILVDDVDASVASIEKTGGRICMSARDMPGVGRFAMMFDPQGALFYVMKPTPPADNPDAASTAFAKYAPKDGHCAWNELATSDPEGALAFYGRQFGWTKDGEMNMGPIGTLAFVKSDVVFGAIMPKRPQMPVSAWTFYFRVPDIDVARSFIESHCGQVVAGPMEIPGGDYSMNAIDPQGAHFAIVGARKG